MAPLPPLFSMVGGGPANVQSAAAPPAVMDTSAMEIAVMDDGSFVAPGLQHMAMTTGATADCTMAPTPPTVVLVDPLSTGVLLQKRLVDSGYSIIIVWGDRTQPAARSKHLTRSVCQGAPLLGAIVHTTINATLDAILAIPADIRAVMCGSEFGVVLEDAVAKGLNERLGTTHLLGSGMAQSTVKVDKHAQANMVRKAGLDAVRETLVYSEDDVKAFLKKHPDMKSMVVKPQTGAGSVGVTFCDSPEAVLKAYQTIIAGEHKAHCGEKYKHYEQAGVLLQEFMEGTEYIVNAVVYNGEAKITALWRYDKRPYNGGSFVCFSKRLLAMDDESPRLQQICDYTIGVLKAVGFQNGAIHGEVMFIPNRGPVLVELNCRLHGGNAAWVYPAEVCMGYSQLSVMMDVYLYQGKDMFDSLPSLPWKIQGGSYQVKMRGHVEGILECVIESQWQRILNLASYSDHCFQVFPGDHIVPTIDMPSVPGEVTLVHHDKDVLERDYVLLNEILREGIFQVKA